MTIALSITIGLAIGVPLGAILQTCWLYGSANQFEGAYDDQI